MVFLNSGALGDEDNDVACSFLVAAREGPIQFFNGKLCDQQLQGQGKRPRLAFEARKKKPCSLEQAECCALPPRHETASWSPRLRD